MMLLFKLGI